MFKISLFKVKSRFHLPCRFLHREKKKKRRKVVRKKKVKNRVSKFKYISLNFCSTSQCELSQLSFHILKQCFPRQEKHPTSMSHRCPFKSGTSPSNGRIYHFNMKMLLLMEALPPLQPLGSSCYKVYFKYHNLNQMHRANLGNLPLPQTASEILQD